MFATLILFSLYGTGAAAVLALFLREQTYRYAASVLVLSTLSGLIGSLGLLSQGSDVVVLGQTQWFFGLRLVLTHIGQIFFALLSGVACLVSWFSIQYLSHYHDTYHVGSTQCLTALFILGMQGVLLAHNTVGFMVAWEVMSLASFFLVLADRSETSVRAAFLYLIMTHLGAMAILGGFLLLGQGSATVDFSALAEAGTRVSAKTALAAFLLFLFGFGSKAGLVPFHVWLPEAHPQAPSHISALMSGLMLKMAVYGFITVQFFALPPLPMWTSLLVMGLGILSAVFGVLYAVIEKDLKRVLAYSSIENMGIIFSVLGFIAYLNTQAGSEAHTLAVALFAFVLLHSVNHGLFKTGLFLSAGTIIHAVHSRSLEMMGGLAKRMPAFSVVFLGLSLAAAALPPFGTFYGEWGFLQTLIGMLQTTETTIMTAALAVLLISVLAFVGGLAIFAMVKLFAIAMLGEPRSHHATEAKPPATGLFLPSAILALGLLVSGVFAPNIVVVIQSSASTSVGLGTLQTAGAHISPQWIFWLAVFLGIIIFLVRRLVSQHRLERTYHTWDCGQPIDASMEYTATALSAPIRFFFRFLLRSHKTVVVTPVISGNPWIATHSMELKIRSSWYDYLYAPAIRLFALGAEYMKRIQNGRIQVYLFLLLATLVVTIILAL